MYIITLLPCIGHLAGILAGVIWVHGIPMITRVLGGVNWSGGPSRDWGRGRVGESTTSSHRHNNSRGVETTGLNGIRYTFSDNADLRERRRGRY